MKSLKKYEHFYHHPIPIQSTINHKIQRGLTDNTVDSVQKFQKGCVHSQHGTSQKENGASQIAHFKWYDIST